MKSRRSTYTGFHSDNTADWECSPHSKVLEKNILVLIVGVAASVMRVESEVMTQTMREEGRAGLGLENFAFVALEDAQFDQPVNGHLVGIDMDILPLNTSL